MTDIALLWSNDLWSADIALAGGDLATDDGLATAVLISLFTDARARPDDVLPDGADRRGWWGDALAEVDGDAIGSRLWLRERAKRIPRTIADIREDIEAALAWLIEDQVARSIAVSVEGRGTLVAAEIVVTRLDGSVGRYKHVWERYQ